MDSTHRTSENQPLTYHPAPVCSVACVKVRRQENRGFRLGDNQFSLVGTDDLQVERRADPHRVGIDQLTNNIGASCATGLGVKQAEFRPFPVR